MFQSNTSKEILYIFLWLVGIIFFYGLVHTFILEPSQHKSETHSTKHTLKSQITHPDKSLVSSEKIPAKTNIKKPSIPTIPEKIKTSIQKSLKNKTNTHTVEKKELQAVNPKTISILSIPSAPNVPSILTLPSVKKVVQKQHTIKTVPAKIPTVDTEKVLPSKKETLRADAVEKVLSKDIDVKRIETSRQQVRQEAEDIRKEAIKLLGL